MVIRAAVSLPSSPLVPVTTTVVPALTMPLSAATMAVTGTPGSTINSESIFGTFALAAQGFGKDAQFGRVKLAVSAFDGGRSDEIVVLDVLDAGLLVLQDRKIGS